MIKIVYVSEGFITKKDIYDRDIPNRILQMNDISPVEFAFTEDKAALEQEGEMRKANLRLEKEGPDWVNHSEQFLNDIKDADIAIIHYSGAGKQFFDAAKNLKLLCVMRSGVENVNLEEAKKHGVTVCYSPGRASEPVADFTLTLMLALMRRLPYNNIAGTGKWRAGAPMGSEGMMQGATVGLFGFGMIAQKVAKRLQGFGCNIITYDPWANKQAIEKYNVELVDNIEDLFKRADYVSVHARLTNDNKGIIDEKLLGLMKPTAYLINTARAGLVNQKDLIKVLEDKKIAGAALDVFESEPLEDNHPFLTLDNVIITPHVAGNGGDFIIRSIESPINEIRHFLKNEKYDFECKK